ncbi:hypothetical protein POK33_37700 [Burkholderia cenocepacia]|uniref:hypothetical protein n=1 Tax=Burkholderia cenocepacia TaxID=95486 RepID=UPI0023B998E8|nr:hypothetical protein [Burkholderia cenocepacia]MDF0506492.1 hypothetical protein [Burkholderia cenocepacia]
MANVIEIAFDCWSLRRGSVDLQAYQNELIAALPNHELIFSLAPDIADSLGMPFAIKMASGTDASMAFDAAKKVWPSVINTAMVTTDLQPDVVNILGDQIKVGHVTVSKNGNETWTLERVREIYKKDGHSITFGLGPIGHASRTVLNEDKVVVTKDSVASVGS